MEAPLPSEFQLAREDAGTRLDQYLVTQLPGLSRSRIQSLIQDGFITLNGSQTKPGAKLRAGDKISVTEPPPTPTGTAAQDIALEILFEDQDLIVLNKPAGMVVHPAAGNWDGTVVNALLFHCKDLSGIGGEQRPGIVHRLDKDTSGCLVAAKNDQAHSFLARQFAGRSVTKIYLAITAGHFTKKSGIIEAAIGRHPVQRKKMTVVTGGRGRPAKTGWRVLGELPTGTLVECTLFTGRTHQIRVHLKHAGYPLLGDEVYGKRGDFARQMLHAWKLGFTHPRTGQQLEFTAPVPADFLAAGVGAFIV